ncbi:MAG: fimbrillin family protein [Alistipes sp.]|jgi:hypothetical protein|nr:fimbrillin family protein [Alistipes sp.]
MKRLFLGAGALPMLALLAVSCAPESVENSNDGGGAINFRPAIGKQILPTTRATEFVGWDEGESINIYAYSSDGLYPGAGAGSPSFVLTNGDGGWSYGTPVEQPGYVLAYYAWENDEGMDADPTSTISGTTFDYTVSATAATQEDLIFAGVQGTTSTEINLLFNHLLSQVNFAVVPLANMTVNVSNIEVNDVNSKGTYTFANGTGSWGNTNTPADYTYAASGDITTATSGVDNGVYYYKSADNALMLMPQALEDGANFTFDYTITDSVTGGNLASGQDVTVPLNDLAEVTVWSAGVRYVYVINFDEVVEGGGDITFSVSVNDWSDSGTVTVPTDNY